MTWCEYALAALLLMQPFVAYPWLVMLAGKIVEWEDHK